MFSSVGAGDGSFVYTHTLKNIICSSGKGSCSFRSPPGFLVDDHQNPIRFKKIISACKCIADIKPTKFTGSHETENLSVGKELDDESYVLIECRNVYKSFREAYLKRLSPSLFHAYVHLLCSISFYMYHMTISWHGEAVGIIGPSGTGKSTILKIMAGLLAPDKVLLYNEPSAGLDPIVSTVVEDLIRSVHIKGKDLGSLERLHHMLLSLINIVQLEEPLIVCIWELGWTN
ncbi:protein TRIGALACTOSYLDIACYLGLYCEROL 3, chloroplastic-like isoform X3 [Olea europaea var. sylvestris]|uniref:protein TRIGALACTOSYLDIACYLGLYCEROL 3, chloroplastic-like isoform X3 n=1 Tax=Olea europaea var. sylvestris TaxID=158386 RepID=UPI000C1D4B11|nr:protein TRIGALACTOSYLDIACYLGLYCEROL 3, chloroplastic-like isoform X3 [Olea europaea var. sylvestris]